MISIRMYLASAGSLSHFLTSMHTAPSVTEPSSGPITYTSGSSGLAIASSDTITAPDSPTLTSMTVTIGNPLDGSSEQLTATTTGTTLTSNFADGVLTVSGVGYLADYQTVLDSLQYADNAATVTAGDRTISIVVNDGTDASTPVSETVDVVQGVNTTPIVTGVSPSSGPAGGGTSVTIAGSGFTSGATVDFGTTAATAVTIDSATQITATAPPREPARWPGRCHRDHVRRDFRHVVQRPVHLPAQRDGHRAAGRARWAAARPSRSRERASPAASTVMFGSTAATVTRGFGHADHGDRAGRHGGPRGYHGDNVRRDVRHVLG